jgi:hypothetical protein
MAEQRPHERHVLYCMCAAILSTCKGKEVVKTARKHIDLVGRKKPHEFPRNDPPVRTRFRADGTRHSSFRRKGHVRVAETFLRRQSVDSRQSALLFERMCFIIDVDGVRSN